MFLLQYSYYSFQLLFNFNIHSLISLNLAYLEIQFLKYAFQQLKFLLSILFMVIIIMQKDIVIYLNEYLIISLMLIIL